MSIGVSFFTEVVGAGPIKNCDIFGFGQFDPCEIRAHPTGSAIAPVGIGQPRLRHATTFARISAREIGIPRKTSRSKKAVPTPHPMGLGPTARVDIGS